MYVKGMLNQTATYWAPSGIDSQGFRGYAAPVQIKCHWEQHGAIATTATGEEIVGDHAVFCEEQLQEDGFMALGTFTAADPKTVTDSYPITEVVKSYSMTATQFITMAVLRSGDAGGV